jgi:hypothetical protein
MFADLHLEISNRYSLARRYFDALCPADAPGPFDPISAVTKGMAFVQMYAAWEYAVKTAVFEASDVVQSHAIPFHDTRLEIVALLETPRLQSIGDSGEKKFWENVFNFLDFLRSTSSTSSGPALFPNDGSHYRIAQISTIWRIFGISSTPFPDVRLGPLVGEVVENRNAIAHGRIVAEEVGRRYSKQDVLGKIDGMRRMAEHVAATLELHCTTRANLVR